MNSGWKFYLDFKPWLGDSDLFVVHRTFNRRNMVLLPATMAETGTSIDKPDVKPFLSETHEQVDDGLGDVTGFLQAALDAAWERGMRPTGFKDFSNELSAVRYHLEDMRKLAFGLHLTVKGPPPQ